MTQTAKVYVQGDEYNSVTQRVFRFPLDKHNYEIVPVPESADIVVWTGGADINPAIYGQKPHACTYFSPERDKKDLFQVEASLKRGQFLIGICRGAQLLNCVPNGGSLWQDVNKHESGVHTVCDTETNEWLEVNSYHHQMMRPTPAARLLAYAVESDFREDYENVWKPPTSAVWDPEKDGDPEAVWYSDTKSLCLQFHPEFGHDSSTQYFFDLLGRTYWRDHD